MKETIRPKGAELIYNVFPKNYSCLNKDVIHEQKTKPLNEFERDGFVTLYESSLGNMQIKG